MRSRQIKPGFFCNEQLGELSPFARLLFIGLWCVSDREGRFEWRPKQLKAKIFPLDNVEIDELLEGLLNSGLICAYEHDGSLYGLVKNFNKHQYIHVKEGESELPNPTEFITSTGKFGKFPNEHGKGGQSPLIRISTLKEELSTKDEVPPEVQPSTPSNTQVVTKKKRPQKIKSQFREAVGDEVPRGKRKILHLTDAGFDELRQRWPNFDDEIETIEDWLANNAAKQHRPDHLAFCRGWMKRNQPSSNTGITAPIGKRPERYLSATEHNSLFFAERARKRAEQQQEIDDEIESDGTVIEVAFRSVAESKAM